MPIGYMLSQSQPLTRSSLSAVRLAVYAPPLISARSLRAILR